MCKLNKRQAVNDSADLALQVSDYIDGKINDNDSTYIDEAYGFLEAVEAYGYNLPDDNDEAWDDVCALANKVRNDLESQTREANYRDDVSGWETILNEWF